MYRFREFIYAGLAAVVLTLVFWWPLWKGGGFVGGDVYSYYFPQKIYYQQRLAAGEFPLWNNRAGHGYPLIAESQTAAFYPLNLLLYSTLDINTAYNANHLLHYVAAFLFTWMYVRKIGLGPGAAAFAGFVYTYGWFPSRSCLEWAIISGAYLPLVLWCFESFLQSRTWRYLILLSIALALQMLAGHYNLAFITQLVLVAYVPLRLWFAPNHLPAQTQQLRRRCVVAVFASMLFGFALASLQLAPTWELKQHSQRATSGEHHRLAQGSLPYPYWSQAIAPWYWYSTDTDRTTKLNEMSAGLKAPTNQVEAHLYFGLFPLGLALIGMVVGLRKRDRLTAVWLGIGLMFLLYTPGWLLPITEHLPGFNFFQDPGRFGIVTTLAVAVLAGAGYDAVRSSRSPWLSLYVGGVIVAAMISAFSMAAETELAGETAGVLNPLHMGQFEIRDIEGFQMTDSLLTICLALGIGFTLFAVAAFIDAGRRQKRRGRGHGNAVGTARFLLSLCMFATTCLDLWLVSRLVTYSPMVDDPPIRHLAESPLRRKLAAFEGEPRLWAPGGNLATILGASSTPPYFTFAPAVYTDRQRIMPDGDVSARIAWLKRAGVTHILTFDPLDENVWPVTETWKQIDPFLNHALARYQEPVYLYELHETRGRVAFVDSQPPDAASLREYRANRITIDAESTTGGRLVLTDLSYPGWQVTIDGQPADPIEFEGMYRAVDLSPGRHSVVWTYEPRSVYWGAMISLAAMIGLAAFAHVRYRHPRRLNWLDGASS